MRMVKDSASIDSLRPAAPQLCQARRRRSPRAARRRLTLIEVTMGLMIIGTAAMAALAALLFSFRVADSNLRSLAALSAARAVVEQILTLDYTTLSGDPLPVDIPSSTVGSLNVDQWNDRQDDLHNTPGLASDDLILSLRPEVTQSQKSTGFECSQVILRFRWQEHSFFNLRTREDALTVVTSAVPSY